MTIHTIGYGLVVATCGRLVRVPCFGSSRLPQRPTESDPATTAIADDDAPDARRHGNESCPHWISPGDSVRQWGFWANHWNAKHGDDARGRARNVVA